MAYRTSIPFSAWRLTPGLKPVEIKIVALNPNWNRQWKPLTSNYGLHYAVEDLYETRDEAIESGYAVLRGQQAKLDKQQANINKKLAALQKAK